MKSARPNTWMPMYWSDYWAKTAHLSPSEHCAYFHLIGAYWERGGPLTIDEDALARIGRLTKPEWKKARAAVLEFFTETAGELHHGRIDAELTTAKESYDRRVERSAKANKERHKDSNKVSNKEADKDSNEDTQPQPQPPSKKETPSPIGLVPHEIPAEERPIGKRPKPKERISPTREPTSEDRAFADSLGISADVEWPQYRDHHLREGSLIADFPASWRTWCRNAVRFAGGSSGARRGSVQRVPTSIATAVAEVIEADSRRGKQTVNAWPLRGGSGPLPQPHGQPPARPDGFEIDDWGFVGGADGVPAGRGANGSPQMGEVIEMVADAGGDPGGMPVAGRAPQGTAQGHEVKAGKP